MTTHLTAFPDHVPKFCAGTVYRPGGVEEVKPPSSGKTTASLLEAGFFLVNGMDPIKTFGPDEPKSDHACPRCGADSWSTVELIRREWVADHHDDYPIDMHRCDKCELILSEIPDWEES